MTFDSDKASRPRGPGAGSGKNPRRALFPTGAALLFLLPLALRASDAIHGRIPRFMDTALYFHPLRLSAAGLMSGGEWPWWSRATLCGAPLFANPQAGLAYPGRWLFLAYPSGATFALGYPLHLGLWAAATCWALRRNGLSRAAAFWAGTVCLAGSYGWTRLQYGGFLETLPWWAVWFGAASAHAKGRGTRWVAVGAACVALMITTGALQLVAFQLACCAVYALARAGLPRRGGRPGGARACWFVFLAATCVLGAGLGSTGWLPQMLAVRETARAGTLSPARALFGSFGSPAEVARALIGPLNSAPADAESSAAVGALVLALCLCVPFGRNRRALWMGAVVSALFAAALSLRSVNELLFRAWPGAARLHDPRRWLGAAQWLIIVAGAAALDDVLVRARPRLAWFRFRNRRRWDALGGGVNGGAMAASAAAISLGLGVSLAALTRGGAASSFPAAARALAGGAVFALGCAAALSRRGWASRVCIALLLCGASLDLARLASSTQRTVDLASIKPDALTSAPDGRAALITSAAPGPAERFISVDWQSAGAFDYRRPDLADWATPNLAAAMGLEDVDGYEPARSARFDAWIKSASAWPGGKQPWPEHFDLAYPALSGELGALAEANARWMIAPVWGLPVYVWPKGNGVWVGPAPGTSGLDYKVVAALDPAWTGPRSIGLAAASGGVLVEEPLTLRQPAFSTQPDFIRAPERVALFRTTLQGFNPGAEDGRSVFLRLGPGDIAFGIYVWSPKLEERYPRAEARGMAALHRIAGADRWINIAGAEGSPNPARWRETARAIRSNSLRVEVEIEWGAATEARLTIHDAYWSGWRARVDGAETPVRPSGPDEKGPWREIRIARPASAPTTSNHVVAMSYFPPGLAWALWLSAASAIACAALLLPPRRRDGRNRAEIPGVI